MGRITNLNNTVEAIKSIRYIFNSFMADGLPKGSRLHLLNI